MGRGPARWGGAQEEQRCGSGLCGRGAAAYLPADERAAGEHAVGASAALPLSAVTRTVSATAMRWRAGLDLIRIPGGQQHCGALVDQGTTVLLTTRYPDEVETGSPPHRGRRHRPRHGGQGQRRTRPDRMLTCGPLIGRQVRSGTAPAQTAAAPLFLLRSTPACRPASHRQPPPSRPRGLLSAAVAPATMPGRLGAITRRNPMPVTVPATRELLGTPDWESPPGSTSTPSAWP